MGFSGRIFLRIAVFAAILTLFFSSCHDRKAELRREWEASPALRIAYWGTSWKSEPLSRRIREAPAALIEKIRIENQVEGFTEIPAPAQPPAVFSTALASVLQSLPQPLKDILEDRFIGVFALRDLGGTGYADVVMDSEGTWSYGLVVLDVDVLMGHTANQWATWKVNSLFRPDTGKQMALKAVIEEPENDTVENAVRFILLHEVGHVLGMLTEAHPSWIEWFNHRRIDMDYPFVKLSWRLSGDNLVSRFDENFPRRKSIRAYGFEKSELGTDAIPAVFRGLADFTDFASPYAAQDPWEDFAESFSTYVHEMIDGRPWKIVLETAGRPEPILTGCWKQARCKAKKDFLEAWMENPLSLSPAKPPTGGKP